MEIRIDVYIVKKLMVHLDMDMLLLMLFKTGSFQFMRALAENRSPRSTKAVARGFLDSPVI